MLAYKCLSEFFFRWTYLAIRQVARAESLLSDGKSRSDVGRASFLFIEQTGHRAEMIFATVYTATRELFNM